MKRARLTSRCVLATAVLIVAGAQGRAQDAFVGPPSPVELGPTVAVEPVPVPRNEAEFKKIDEKITSSLDAIQGEIAKLADSAKTRELTEAEKAYEAALKGLVDTLKVYQSQAKELRELLLQIHGLEDSTTASDFAAELTALQKAADEVQADGPRDVSAEALKKAEADLEAARTNLAASTKAQEERAQRRTELPARLEAFKADLQAAQAALNQSAVELEAIKGKFPARSMEYDAAELTQDKLRYAAGLLLLRMSRLEVEAKRDALVAAQAEQRLPLRRQLVAAHEKRVERYKQLRARSNLQMAQEELAQAKSRPDSISPYELAFLEHRVRTLRFKQELSAMERELGTRGRFSEADFAELKEDLTAATQLWSSYMDVLDRKSSDKIRTYYRRIGLVEESRRGERDRLLTLYDDALDDRVRLSDRIDQIRDENLAELQKLTELERAEPTNETVVRIKGQIQTLVDEFEKFLNDMQQALDDRITRLAEAGALLNQHVDQLAAWRSRMYWSYLRVQDYPLWKYKWAESQTEWAADAPKRQAVAESIRAGRERVGMRSAITISSILIVLLVATWYARGRLLRYADRLEETVGADLADTEQTIAPVSDRLHLQLIRFLGRSAPMVVPTGVAWLWIIFFSPLDGRLSGPIMGTLLFAGLAFGLISTLFSRSKPRFRLVPCSNVVAAHYRRWLRVLLYVSVLLVPLPLILNVFDWMPYTRNYMWSAYKILALCIVLIFALPRQTVLRVAGRPQAGRYQLLYFLLSTGYPLLYLALVALVVLQVMGFGPLVSYVINGAAGTLVVMIGAVLVVRYLGDMMLRISQQLAVAREKAAEAGGTAEREHSEALSAGREVTLLDRTNDGFDQQLWLGIVLSVFRWVVGLAGLVLILGFWGISRVDLSTALNQVVIAGSDDRPAVTIGRALAAIAVLVLVWVFSKAVRAFLEARIFPTYSALDRGGRVAISTLLHYTFVFLGLYFCLAVMRIPLGALTVVLGTLGLGLGLGLQPVFVNFLSGIIILFERHVKVGDLIEVNGVLGEVVNISLRATVVKTFDNIDMIIPNADFVSGSVVNWTMNDPRIRGKLDVGVDYDSDVRLVERLLLQVAKESKLALKEPPPRVRFMQFGDSALLFSLFAWFYNSSDRFDFLTDARYRILELFREHGVVIPFPEQTLNINEGTPLRVQVENITRDGAARPEVVRPVAPVEKPVAKR